MRGFLSHRGPRKGISPRRCAFRLLAHPLFRPIHTHFIGEVPSFRSCAIGVAMRRTRKEGPKLAFGQKVTRLGHRLRDREWRKYGLTLVAGKMLGILVLFAAIWAVKQYATYGTVFADDAAVAAAPTTQAAAAVDPYAAIPKADHINALNTVWT